MFIFKFIVYDEELNFLNVSIATVTRSLKAFKSKFINF